MELVTIVFPVFQDKILFFLRVLSTFNSVSVKFNKLNFEQTAQTKFPLTLLFFFFF